MHNVPGVVPVPNPAFPLTLEEAGQETGDFVRYKLWSRRGRSRPVQIDDGFTGLVYVTPDGRYVITESLYVLDVAAWTQYALFDALHISNYTSLEAISRDGKRLFISRKDCAIGCPGQSVEYFVLTLP